MQHDARNDAQRALYALLAGAEGCGPAARSARLAQDDELADFLLRVQDEIVSEAKRHLTRRLARGTRGSEEKIAENLSLEAQG